jgi:predicted secreted protein
MAEPQPVPPPGAGPRAPREHRDLGGVVFGLIVLAIGTYFLLTETLGLVLPDLGELWPLFVIGFGVWILASAMRGN